jgi:hypothetical protein
VKKFQVSIEIEIGIEISVYFEYFSVAKILKVIICHKKRGKIFDLKKMPQKVWQKNIFQKIATTMKKEILTYPFN